RRRGELRGHGGPGNPGSAHARPALLRGRVPRGAGAMRRLAVIHTIRRAPRHTLDELAHLDAPGQLLVTDFHIDGAEAWHRVPWGLEHPGGRTVCIDHHAPIPEMQRQVTSTMLAVERVRGAGPPDPGRDVVVVNHTDCDAVLAAGLLSGRLDAEDPW